MEIEKDRELWYIARKRVKFKRHLAIYLVINAWFWFIWHFSDEKEREYGLPWPVWSMLGWGIGLVFSFLNAYTFPKYNAVEKEYQKLKDKNPV